MLSKQSRGRDRGDGRVDKKVTVLLDSASVKWHYPRMSYSIKDLVRQSGETKRTIRYYVQLGLLPPPERAGRGASYNDEHLTLLRRIRQLQGDGYRLQQVRERLSSPSMPTNRREAAPALDALAASMPAPLLRALAAPRYAVPKSSRPAASTVGGGDRNHTRLQLWRRVSITPDIELHIRGRSARTATRLERVLRQALGEETQELDRKGWNDEKPIK